MRRWTRISSTWETIPTKTSTEPSRGGSTSARSNRFGRFLSAHSTLCASLCAFALLVATGMPGNDARASAIGLPCVDSSDVSTTPRVPRAGTLFELRIAGARGRPAVTIADVPLVQRETSPARDGASSTQWLAAVPIDSTRGITVSIACDGGTPVSVRLAVDSGRYRNERLRVSPRFSAPPDSALALRLEQEAARASAVSRGALETPKLWRDSFVAPRVSRITSTFGNRRTFNGETVSWHNGTDYAGAVGTPVRASNRGVVRLVGAFYLGGNVVYLDHGAGLTTAYLHLSRTLVAVGDTVERGATIGRTGATGRVTGPHLHFIARLGGITVDPLTLVGRR